jgi:hypothetical protein
MPPGTKVTAADGGPDKDPYKPGKKLAELIEELKGKTPPKSIDDDNPLIVVAPAPAPHPPGQGKKLSCSRSPWKGKKRCLFIVEFIQIVLR